MEIEDLVLSCLAIGFMGGLILYAMTNPLHTGIPVVETVAIGGLWLYLFSNPNFF
ncbi:hypothetical protein [Methanolobus bombayensis]|uniref:hypothetical protein n=1 Tax=Methanolobus bombayensis TaxID=38023 RepID=UPI001AE689B5|nr:hypothetical protein [Methanolobus bombayensis]MBP1909543.1 hypothetical protein [Methanolobus bombayensis]